MNQNWKRPSGFSFQQQFIKFKTSEMLNRYNCDAMTCRNKMSHGPTEKNVIDLQERMQNEFVHEHIKDILSGQSTGFKILNDIIFL